MLIIRKAPSRPKPEPTHTTEGGGGVERNHNTPQGELDQLCTQSFSVCVCVYVCIYIYIYVCVCVCVTFTYTCMLVGLYRPPGDAITTCADLACTDAKNPN